MVAQMRLTSLEQQGKLPLSRERFFHLEDELDDAARGFAGAGHSELAAQVERARDELRLAYCHMRNDMDAERGAA